MTREELFALAQEHARTVWGSDDDGADDASEWSTAVSIDVLGRHGISSSDAVVLATAMASGAHGTETLPGLTALVIEGFIFGLWVADKELDRAAGA